jgi:hypothetical protein
VRTGRRPAQLAARETRTLRIDLEPDVTGTIPGRRRLALGHLGHVELQCAWVADGRHGGEAEGCARRDLVGAARGARAGRELVAADLVGSYLGGLGLLS